MQHRESHTGQTQGGTCWDTYESKWQKLKTEKIWKATKEKQQITYEGILIRLSADFSAETLQARREWHNIFQMMKGKSYNQEYSTQQGSSSDLIEKSKVLQTSKS